MPRISVYIIAFNEADKIGDAVKSVLWADEIVVADSGSTDETAAIASELGARIVQIPFTGFGELRNQAMAACSHEWIFSLDSDERATPESRDEILATISRPDALDAWYVPRRNFFMGRWIRHGGWYPDYRQPQLFRRGTLRFSPDPVHERYEIHSKRPPGYLKNPIRQIPFRNLEEVLRKANRYSTLGAEKLKDRRPGMWTAFGHALVAFIRIYLLKRGFLDGWPGFVIAFGNFEGTFYRYAKAHEARSAWEPPQQDELRRPSP